MQNSDDTFQQVKKVLVDLFDIDPAVIKLETLLIDDLDLDSLDAVDMASELGTVSDMKFTNDDLRSLRTVGDVVNAISSKTL